MIEIRKLFLNGGRVYNDRRFRISDTKTPYFSWAAVSDVDGDYQTAFDASVFCGKTELWHSGWTECREQGVIYDGKALPAGRNLDFTLRIRNTRGEESELFSTQFVCGVIDEWEGKWITVSEENDRAALCFRRDFRLEKPVAEACLFVSGIGYHKVTINGAEVDDSEMDPAFSDYTKSCYYAVITNVEEYLENGGNTIGVEVANGWRKNTSAVLVNSDGTPPILFGTPMLNAMLLVYYTDGTKSCLFTDEKWQWKTGSVTEAHVYDGETYDANAADPLWDQPGAGELPGFKPVVINENGPGGILRPMALEPIRDRETYDPIEVTEPERGTYIVDFGQNLAGVCSLILPEKMKKGQKITLRFAEVLDEDGFLYTAPLRGAKQTDTYIASGDERDLSVWTPRFTYHGFRYCEVKGIPLFDGHTIRAIARYTDVKNESFFRCGSAAVNTLQKMVLQTEKANIHSILTDCPQRDERMAWMNDATVRFEETPYNFDIGRLFAKVIRDIRDNQSEDGSFCCCSPRISFGHVPADPVCSSYLVAGKQLYYHIGDLQILREAFDGFAAWEKCLLAHSTDYIVNYSYYGDWAGPAYVCPVPDGANSLVTEGILMSTGYSYYNCKTLAFLADVLGRTEDEKLYSDLADKIRGAFLAKWWHPETAVVGSGSEGAQAFALWLEILPEESRQAAADVMRTDLVARGYQFTTGNLCTRYLFDMLAKYGYLEDAWKLVTKETYPSYGFMMQNEATTVWERFELKKKPGMNSHNHPMYGAVGYWFYAYLCGIIPTDRGFDRVSIKPYYPEKLLSAQAAVDTVKGPVSVRWTKRYGQTQLAVQIPFGMTADIAVGTDTVVCGSGYHHFTF